MTAEIAILNKTTVALAADSAVTIASGVENTVNKIYPTANKIFSLNYKVPVGVMIYNRSELMGVPWDVLVKEYRLKHSKHFSQLFEYWDSIKDFLIRLPSDLFADGYTRLFQSILVTISQKISSADSRERQKVISEIVEEVKKNPRLDELFTEKLRTDWQRVAESVFESFEWDKVGQKTEIKPTKEEFLKVIMCLSDHLISENTGFVLAGFGTDQIFPEVRTFSIEGMFNGFLRYAGIENRTMQISHNNSAGIIPFAQSKVVENIIQGIDNEHIYKVYNLFSYTFQELVNNQEISEDMRRLSHEVARKLSDQFWIIWQKYREDFYSSPIIEAVEFLSKDQLAVMAETLVELTAFKQRFAMNTEETVGGPIDVAVISKGDGLIWIKRKHYFDPKLNVHFMQKYFGDKQ
jgi:hypothetical protein